jgi:glyoxylase I family protein
MALFACPDFFDGKPPFKVATVYHHYIAINVNSDEAIEYFGQKLESEDIRARLPTRAFSTRCLKDPNGMNLELCYSPATANDFFLRAGKGAYAELKQWVATRVAITGSTELLG